TGAIGHVSATAGLELNVAIRTFEFAAAPDGSTRVWLGVGDGIVADSDPDDEYAEVLAKARPLVHAIGWRFVLEASAVPTDDVPGRSTVAAAPAVVGSRVVYETVLVGYRRPGDFYGHLARLDASVRAVYGTTVRAGLEDAVRHRVSGLG